MVKKNNNDDGVKCLLIIKDMEMNKIIDLVKVKYDCDTKSDAVNKVFELFLKTGEGQRLKDVILAE